MESGNSNETTDNNSLIPDAPVAAPVAAPAQDSWKNYKPKTNQNEQINRPPRSRGSNAGVIVGVISTTLFSSWRLTWVSAWTSIDSGHSSIKSSTSSLVYSQH